MHFCKARIAIADDAFNIYAAGTFDPVSWPEVQVLQFLHGDVAVTDVEPFVSVEQSPYAERQRLSEKYREAVVAEVFGGRQPPSEMNAPGARLQGGVTWFNPLSHSVEVTGGSNGHTGSVMKEPDVVTEAERTAGGRFAARK